MKLLLVCALLCVGGSFAASVKASSSGVVTCYYGTWANGRSGKGRFGVSDLPTHLCTHIVYSFLTLDGTSGGIVAPEESTVEGKGNSVSDLIALKKKNPELKILAAIGGWNEASTNFSAVVNDKTKRALFVKNLYNYVDTNGFDGLDLDWEYLHREKEQPLTKYLVTNNSVHTWINNGASPSKLVLGLGAYGKTFTLTSLDNTSTGAPVTGAGVGGPYVGESGTYSYLEICEDQKDNPSAWSITEVEGNYVYANKDLFWVGYDNPNTIKAKAQYAKNTGLAGIMYWAIDLDDFSGTCGDKFPLVFCRALLDTTLLNLNNSFTIKFQY
ncbi:acidic mammalian chitinase-like [Leguminivora glycinivorella]|uniref:acidic mammalian chitinase-like n=1 Tax=Leguminivora glycinivorella TaxID=1035111 RepID=UPI00200BCA10|nr:acidic mammalian chitinase-like [Leguminivora glycinivorella]